MSKNTNKTGKQSTVRDIDIIINKPREYAKSISVKRLVTILQKLSDIYYTGIPIVSDDIYDIMLDVLKERDPNNQYLFQTGVSKIEKTDVKLPYPMPSLNKIKPGEVSFKRWMSKYNGSYILSDKLDGISVQIHKDKKGNVNLYTKKQTDVGTCKNYLLKYLVDADTLDNLPKSTSIRGEVVISRKHFKLFEDAFANPRSVMSGLMNTDTIDTRIAEKATIVFYSVLYPRYAMKKQLKLLKRWGFNTVWNKSISKDAMLIKDNNDTDEIDDIVSMENYLKTMLIGRMEKAKYDIDGLVVVDDSMVHDHNKDNPKHAMAFKINMAKNMRDVKVKEIIWEPTMYGYLQPVIRIKPTKLPGGVVVTFVTAHNAKYVYDNNIGKGSTIRIVRSGDVIPYIEKVVRANKKPDMPDLDYEWNDTEVEIIVTKPTGDIKRSINIKKLVHFFKTIKVKYLSEGVLSKLYDEGYDSVINILIMADTKDTEPYDIHGLGEKTLTKIYKEIDKAMNNIQLPELMSGSLIFGRGMGVKKIREIIKKHPDIMDYGTNKTKVIKDMIMDIKGFSDISATKFSKNLKSFCTFVKKITDSTQYTVTTNKVINSSNNGNGSMVNQKVVLTGFREKSISDYIENNGGKVMTSISAKTTLLIYIPSIKKSSKIKKAETLGIKMISKDDFMKKHKL